MNKKRVILIGGAPTVGKSCAAKKLAEQLKLPWISTDTIREQMRKIARKKDYPSLFYFCKATPVKFLASNTAEQVVRSQNRESEDVWKGVNALIATTYDWEAFIIEGVAILPRLAAKLKNTKTVFLVDENIARIRKTIFTRGLWDDSKKYPDSVKEKEVEWVIAFNNYIKKEAKKYGLPVVRIANRKNYLNDVKRALKF